MQVVEEGWDAGAWSEKEEGIGVGCGHCCGFGSGLGVVWERDDDVDCDIVDGMFLEYYLYLCTNSAVCDVKRVVRALRRACASSCTATAPQISTRVGEMKWRRYTELALDG